MQLYLNVFDRESLITHKDVLDSYRKEGKGTHAKHLVTISGVETQVFTESQVKHNRLFLDGVQITDPKVLATHKKKGRGSKTRHYVEINGEETLVFTSSQLNDHRLFLNGEHIIKTAVLATHTKKTEGTNTLHFVEINGKEIQVFTDSPTKYKRLFLLNGDAIIDPEILATYKKEKHGSETKHFVIIQGVAHKVKKPKFTLAKISNNQVNPGSTEVEEPEIEPVETASNRDALAGTILDNLMNNMISIMNPSDTEKNTNHDISAHAAVNQNEVDVADDAAFDVTDEDNDGELVEQPLFKKQRSSASKPLEVDSRHIEPAEIIDNLMNQMMSSNQVSRPLAQPSSSPHPSVALFNSPMFFASQARLQNVSNDRSQDLTTTSSVYDQQKNCLKAMADWLNTLSLEAIQQQYPFCPAPIINFKSDIASLCATVIDSELTKLIPENMLTQDNLLKLRYIKAFQYNSATPFDHQCLARFIKCVQSKKNSLNQPTSQTTAWKSNLR